MILAVKLVFTAATLAFLWGYRVRHSNNGLHRKLMLTGFACTVGIAVVLVVGVHVFGESYRPAGWLLETTGSEAGARAVLLAHRGVATLTFLFLLAQLFTGLRRHPLHKKLYKVFIPLWVITYGSGLVVFV